VVSTATRYSEVSVLTRPTRRRVAEDDILYSHHREIHKCHNSVFMRIQFVHDISAQFFKKK
jgi:hypothetical protein